MRSWLAAGVVALLLASGCSLGKGNVFSLSVGDCFNSDALTDEITTVRDVDMVSCSEPHVHEVYHQFELTGSSWPGESSVIERADSGCLTAFAPFVGIEYGYSEWHFSLLFPLEDAWNKLDHREVTCYLGLLEYEQTTGSARGTLRERDLFLPSVGDCFNSDAFTYEPIDFWDLDMVSCSEPHMYEVYHQFELTGSFWPGESSVIERADSGCLTEFAPFVGIEYEYSEWYYYLRFPYEDSWNKLDDREVGCFLGFREYEQRTGSARGTRR